MNNLNNLIFIIAAVTLTSCSHFMGPSAEEIDLFCQDLSVLLQRIKVIETNIANATTTRVPTGGPYVRKIIKGCHKGICEIVNDESPPILKYEPKHPDANKDGYVAYPNIILAIEKADERKWERVYELVMKFPPIKGTFFLNDPGAKSCFEKYPALKENLDYSEYLGRKETKQ